MDEVVTAGKDLVRVAREEDDDEGPGLLKRPVGLLHDQWCIASSSNVISVIRL